MGWDDSPTTSSEDIYHTGWDNNKIGGWDNPVRIDNAFIFTVTTTGADTFQLPIYNGGTYDFKVIWGDGNSDIVTAYDDVAANHSYAGAGTYTVKITGTITGWRFANAGDKALIHEIKSWGPLNLGNSNGYFYGCSNLTITATDILDLTNTTTFQNAFRSCSSLTAVASMNSWDMSSVLSLELMFYSASSFNQSLNSWDISSVTTLKNMFTLCSAFNGNISSWDTSSVNNMQSIFNSTPFNQNIGAWDTSSVTVMADLFRTTSAFNQDISSWDTSSVTTMQGMFRSASSFDQDIGSLDITALINATEMFLSATLSTANYDALLIGWEAQVEKPNVTFHGGSSKYSAGAAATARAALITNGWNITDGGQV